MKNNKQVSIQKSSKEPIKMRKRKRNQHKPVKKNKRARNDLVEDSGKSDKDQKKGETKLRNGLVVTQNQKSEILSSKNGIKQLSQNSNTVNATDNNKDDRIYSMISNDLEEETPKLTTRKSLRLRKKESNMEECKGCTCKKSH